jgi:tetratricopeptide (TPR) repeat protein
MKARRRSRPSAASLTLGIAAIVGSSFGLYRWCYLPYRCNIFERATQTSMLAIQDLDAPLRRAAIARRNLERALDWLDLCPEDLDLYMIAGGSFRQLGRSSDAVPMYERALQMDRRPEIYLNLGQSQAESGQTKQAVINLSRAVMFDPSLIAEVPAPLQGQVQALARVGSNL